MQYIIIKKINLIVIVLKLIQFINNLGYAEYCVTQIILEYIINLFLKKKKQKYRTRRHKKACIDIFS